MQRYLFVGFLVWSSTALAEEKACQIQGMHCKGCVEMVEEKICRADLYEVCKGRIVDADKRIGEFHLKTKKADAKVDLNQLKADLEPTGYSLGECRAPSQKEKTKS